MICGLYSVISAADDWKLNDIRTCYGFWCFCVYVSRFWSIFLFHVSQLVDGMFFFFLMLACFLDFFFLMILFLMLFWYKKVLTIIFYFIWWSEKVCDLMAIDLKNKLKMFIPKQWPLMSLKLRVASFKTILLLCIVS